MESPDPQDSLMARVLALFECGLDTKEISLRLGYPEARIERVLHIALSKRKSTQKGLEPPAG